MPETIVRFDDRRPIPAAVFVGNENDNLVESVEFELAEWLSEAVVYIYLTANGKSDVVNLGTERVFDITRTHTHEAGRWEAYLEAYLNGDRVWHSDEFAMYVGALPAIGKQIEQQYPTAIEDALKAAEALTGLTARAETLPEGSEPTVRFDEEAGEIVYGLPLGPKGDAGFSPTIRTTAVSGGYEISITNPDGSMSVFTVTNGMSPTVRVSKIDGGNRVVITDASGPKTFDVMDGKDGDEVTADAVKAALGYTPASDARVSALEQDMAEVKKITDNFELFVPKFANTAEGDTLVLTDSAEGALQGMTVYGKTTQDGTPTPDAPVPLVIVGDDGAVDVTVAGKNLLNINAADRVYKGIAYTVNSDGSVTCKGTATEDNAFINLNYINDSTLSLASGSYIVSGGKDGAAVSVVVSGATAKWQESSEATITIPDTAANSWVRVAVQKAGTTVDTTIYPMIRRVEVSDSSYEPYKAQTLTLSTPNGLPSVGDARDEIDLERGVYVQRIGEITLDGATVGATSVLAPEGRTPYCFINSKEPLANKSPVQSTHFVYALTTKHGTTYGNSGETTIRLFADGLDTKEKWNTWFAAEYANGTPVVVRFILATPIETPLSAEEITAFKALKTHYPTTTIYNDESARMAIKYAADTKNYIDQKLATLAAAMVNNL